jgi:GNAT superfamily N-acetyltransferase
MKSFRRFLSESHGFSVTIEPSGTNAWDITPTVNGEEIGTMTVVGNDHELQVFSVQIYRQHRGKGYGKALYQAVLDFGRSKGFRTFVSGNSVSTSAQRLWKSIGGQEFQGAHGPRWSVPTTHKITGAINEDC